MLLYEYFLKSQIRLEGNSLSRESCQNLANDIIHLIPFPVYREFSDEKISVLLLPRRRIPDNVAAEGFRRDSFGPLFSGDSRWFDVILPGTVFP